MPLLTEPLSQDTGLGVRKRVIKLLKGLYATITDTPRQVDIATRLVLRMADEDDSVKDLAIKTVEELWFPPVTPTKGISYTRDNPALTSKVVVIMGVSANFKDRQSPLEDILHKIISEKQENDAGSIHTHYSDICETLIDGLVDASDFPGFVCTSLTDA
jgi:cohesin loading factor subunit SCC2